jgi:hypothetical protein
MLQLLFYHVVISLFLYEIYFQVFTLKYRHIIRKSVSKHYFFKQLIFIFIKCNKLLIIKDVYSKTKNFKKTIMLILFKTEVHYYFKQQVLQKFQSLRGKKHLHFAQKLFVFEN